MLLPIAIHVTRAQRVIGQWDRDEAHDDGSCCLSWFRSGASPPVASNQSIACLRSRESPGNGDGCSPRRGQALVRGARAARRRRLDQAAARSAKRSGGMDLMSAAIPSTATLDRAARAERRWLVLVVVAVAQLMLVLDGTIVNIALPSAQQALGFSDSERQWVVTAYALSFGSLLLVGGRLGDMFSRKWVFITGLVGFALASAIGGAAGSFAVLVTARALQGAFGAVLAPAALGTLVSTFTDPRERGRAFGVFGSVAAGGSAIGLVLGGVLTEYLSWRWCLYVNLVFAAMAAAGALAYLRGGRPASRPQMDWPGAVLACAGLFAIVFGFSQAETAGWTAALTVGSLVGGIVLLAGFVVAEQRVPHPLLRLPVIVDRARGGAYVAVGMSGLAIFGTFLFLTFFLQVVKGFSPLTTGLLFLPMTACILISSTLSGNIALGPHILISAGMVLSAGAMALLTQVTVTSSYVSGVLPALIVLGLGLGQIFAQAITPQRLALPA